jgi:hypothetical protein
MWNSKVELLAELPFPAERVLENTKLGSCATVTRIAISGKASRRQLLQ